jgi:catechol O-methyltransferase
VVVADNVKFPGVPAYHSYMRDNEDTLWRTTEHRAHIEYQSLIRDLVLESEYLGRPA